MLDNWLDPSTIDICEDLSSLSHSIKGTFSESDYRRRSVFIVTDSSKFASESKKALYSLKNHFNDLHIYDLGSFKNSNPEFAISVLRELIPSDGRIILLSENDNYFDSIFRALEYSLDHISLAFMNSRLDQILEERTARSLKSQKLLNVSALGYQRHYCSPKVISYLYESFVHHLSFGQIRKNIALAEPILRSANAASFDTSILQNDILGSPNGLDGLEACQLAKYCGMSPKLKVFSISNQSGADCSTTSNLVGQMLWYFMEGMSTAEEDKDFGSAEYFQEHLVQTDFSNQSFTFWKSNRTKRWWFEIPDGDGKRGNIYPCNQEDYDLACRNEISSYLLDQINLDH